MRQAIEHEAISETIPVPENSHTSWAETLRFVEERKALGITGEPFRWNREEIYEERENC